MAGGELRSLDPTTGAVVGTVEMADALGLDRAVARAGEAFAGEWSRDGRLRATALAAWADALEAAAGEVSDLIVSEVGKVTSEARIEVALSVDALRYNAGLARYVGGEAGALPDGSIAYVERVPVGVTGLIVPWNAPVILLLRDLAPALAAGVTAVVKPSPEAPLATERVVRLGLEAGVPEGTVEVVFGGADIGRGLVEHPKVRAIAFTGSTETGRAVMRSAATDFTRVLLELGGKGVSVVFADADIEAALDACLAAAFLVSGQFCMANTRLLVERAAYEPVRAAVVERVARLRAGDPRDPATDLGPLISAAQRERVGSYVELARSTARVEVGGETEDGGEGAALMQPAVVTEVPGPESPLVADEIFGPVVTVERFEGEDEAVALANASPYGLASSVWTSQVARAWRVARALEAGTVWVNRFNRTFPEIPSGGMKHSGIGRTRGLAGLDAFCELKHVNWETAGR